MNLRNLLAGRNPPSKGRLNLARGDGSPEVFYPLDYQEVAATVLAVLVLGIPPIGVTFLLIGYLLFF